MFLHVVAPALLVGGCAEIDGGAVEYRWRIQDQHGTDVDCERAGIEQVRLVVAPAPDGVDADSLVHTCEDGRAGALATSFDVPGGSYLFSLEPRRARRALGTADGVNVPGPLRATVAHGEVTDLDVFLILVEQGAG